MSRTTLARLVLALALGIASAAYGDLCRRNQSQTSDFRQLTVAGSLLLHGRDPYTEIGPGRQIPLRFPLFYPAPAAVVAAPFALVPQRVADVLFAGFGAALLAWALTRRRLWNPQLLVFTSFAMITATQDAQWSPYLTAAAVFPSLGLLYAGKPSVALAYLAAYPSRLAVVAATVFGLLTVVVWPWWPREWLHNVGLITHMSAPVMRPGGVLLLLALLRWRRPEARLLAVLACIPQTPVMYDALPLFLAVNTAREGVILSVLMFVAGVGANVQGLGLGYDAWMTLSGRWMLCVYFWTLVIVLRRPNVAEDAAPDTQPALEPALA